MLLQELLWSLPFVAQSRQSGHVAVAPSLAWSSLGRTIVLDTLLLAFLRVPISARQSRGFAIRMLQASCRLTGDFLPLAAAFFLWSAVLITCAATSLVPFAIILFRQALRNARRCRYRHGSLQLALLVLRMLIQAAGLLAASSHGGTSRRTPLRTCFSILWLWYEVNLAFDVLMPGRLRARSTCFARDRDSQVMWAMAVVGQCLLAARADDRKLPIRSSLFGFQDVALAIMIIDGIGVHYIVFVEWLRRGRSAIQESLTRFDPAHMVFFDCPVHRDT